MIYNNNNSNINTTPPHIVLNSLNIRGLKRNLDYIPSILPTKHPTLLFLQETWISNLLDSSFLKNYIVDLVPSTPHPNSRPSGGLAILATDPAVKSSAQILPLRSSWYHTILVSSVVFINAYIPPSFASFAQILPTITAICNQYADKDIVFAGDFNIHIHKNGRLLLTELLRLGFIDLHPLKPHARADYILLLNRKLAIIPEGYFSADPITAKVSDHGLFSTNIPLPLPLKTFLHLKPPSLGFKVVDKNQLAQTLENSDRKLRFYNILDQIYPSTIYNIDSDIDEVANDVVSVINIALAASRKDSSSRINVRLDNSPNPPETMKTTNKPSKKPKFGPWNDELEKLKCARNRTLRSYNKLPAENGTKQILKAALAVLTKKIRRIRASLASTDREQACLLLSKGPLTKSYSLLCTYRRQHPSSNNPSRLLDNPSQMDEYEQYYRSLYASHSPSSPYTPLVASDSLFCTVSARLDDLIPSLITKTPRRKAPGLDGITNELLRLLPQTFITNFIVPFFTLAYITNRIPRSWTLSTIKLIWKRKGSPSDIAMHRPIAITSNLRKLYERIVLEDISNELLPLHPAQAGFRSQRSTMDQAAALNYALKAHSNKVGVAFLDITKAFDTVDRQKLYNILTSFGGSEALLARLKTLFDHNSSLLCINQSFSNEIPLGIGVLQGSILSPVLYAYFVDPLVSQLAAVPSELPFNTLWYADDAALLATSPETLQHMLDICTAYANSNNFSFSAQKSELLLPSEFAHFASSTPFTLHQSPLVLSTSFTYLGYPFDLNGINLDSLTTRVVNKATNSARLLNSAGFTVSRLPPMLISLLLKGVCLSQLQYAFVFLTNSKSSPFNIRLESAFSYCFNLLFRVKTKTSIAVICLLLNTVPVFQRHSLLLRKFQLNFGFHLENGTPLGRCIQQQIPDRRLKHIYHDETRSDSADLIRDSFADFKRQLMTGPQVLPQRFNIGRLNNSVTRLPGNRLQRFYVQNTRSISLKEIRYIYKWKLNACASAVKRCPFNCTNHRSYWLLTQHHIALCILHRYPQLHREMRTLLHMVDLGLRTFPPNTTEIDVLTTIVLMFRPAKRQNTFWARCLGVVREFFARVAQHYK